jgi:hypothetical protein
MAGLDEQVGETVKPGDRRGQREGSGREELSAVQE